MMNHYLKLSAWKLIPILILIGRRISAYSDSNSSIADTQSVPDVTTIKINELPGTEPPKQNDQQHAKGKCTAMFGRSLSPLSDCPKGAVNCQTLTIGSTEYKVVQVQNEACQQWALWKEGCFIDRPEGEGECKGCCSRIFFGTTASGRRTRYDQLEHLTNDHEFKSRMNSNRVTKKDIGLFFYKGKMGEEIWKAKNTTKDPFTLECTEPCGANCNYRITVTMKKWDSHWDQGVFCGHFTKKIV